MDPTFESNDSTVGKIMEKAGSVLKDDKLVQKGQEKREVQSQDED